MDKVNLLRLSIDDIDQKIMNLLEERFGYSIEIGERKKRINNAVLDTNREQEILDKTLKHSHSQEIAIVYKTIMEQSKSLQRK